MDGDLEIKLIDEIQGLDQTDRARILGAHRKIRSLLGNSRADCPPVLAEAPIYPFMHSPTLESQLQVVEFADDIASLEKCANFNELVGKLRRRENCRSAYYELKVASRFLKKNCTVEFVPEKGAEKKPDLLVMKGDDTLLIEVHALEQSKEEKETQSDLWAIVHTVMGVAGVRMGGKIYKRLSVPVREEVCRSILNKITNSERFEGHERIVFPHAVDIHLYTAESEHKVPAEYRGGRLEGAVPKITEPHRLRTSIKRKVRQLPKDHEGLLYIVDNNLWDHAFKEGFADALVDELDQTIFDYPNLSAVVVYQSVWTGGPEINKTDEGSGYSRRILTTGRTLKIREDYLLILNKYASRPLFSWAKEALGFGES
jgi:hypothetical protein